MRLIKQRMPDILTNLMSINLLSDSYKMFVLKNIFFKTNSKQV